MRVELTERDELVDPGDDALALGVPGSGAPLPLQGLVEELPVLLLGQGHAQAQLVRKKRWGRDRQRVSRAWMVRETPCFTTRDRTQGQDIGTWGQDMGTEHRDRTWGQDTRMGHCVWG